MLSNRHRNIREEIENDAKWIRRATIAFFIFAAVIGTAVLSIWFAVAYSIVKVANHIVP